MKAGDIFEHPIEGTEKKVKLIAVSSDKCADCIFDSSDCKSDKIGRRRRDITGSCAIDKVVYQLYKDKKK